MILRPFYKRPRAWELKAWEWRREPQGEGGIKFPHAPFRAQESCVEGKAHNLKGERFTVKVTTRIC